MRTLETKRITPSIGAEVLGVDIDRLLHDRDFPEALAEALEANGVLLFRGLYLDDAMQVAFSRRLGDLAIESYGRFPEIMEVSFDPKNPHAKYLAGTATWHMDGTVGKDFPPKATILTARIVPERGGETEFASTYAAYEALGDEEKARFASYTVVHTFETAQRRHHPSPTPEQLADWSSRPAHKRPLVWEHLSGRRSLVLGGTMSHIAGMDPDESRALLQDLVERTTRPDRIFRHTWSVGDMVIWDNPGSMHHVCEFDRTAPRVLHRTELLGNERIVAASSSYV